MSNNNDLFNEENKKNSNRNCSTVHRKNFKRIINFKKAPWLIAATFIFIFISGSILTYFTFKSENFRNLVEYFSILNVSSDLNVPKISNGIEISINKVIYDEVALSIFYTVKSNTPMKEAPEILNKDIKFNNVSMILDSTNDGYFQNDNKTYVGKLDCFVNSKAVIPNELLEESSYESYLKVNYFKDFLDIPSKFLLTLEINQIGEIKENHTINGQWDFNVPIVSEKTKETMHQEDINISLNNIYKNTSINKLITTPINTVIQLTSTFPDFNLNFQVFDNKGRYIEPKEAISSGYIRKNKENKYYYNYQFQNIFDDTEELTFIPYRPTVNDVEEEKNNSMTPLSSTYKIPRKLETPLNLKGETRLNTTNGKEYGTITKIELMGDKTKFYIKSRYALNAMPVEIINKDTNEVILPTSNFNTLEPTPESYIKNTGEFVVVFDKPLTGSNYYVSYNDHSESMIVFEDNIFTVKVPK